MTIEVVHRAELTVVGILVDGYWNDLPSIVPAAWRSLFSRVREIPIAEDPPRYVEVSFERSSNLFHEMVAVVAPPDSVAPHGMHRVTIPRNRYLHVSYNGPLVGIADQFQAIYDHASRTGIAATNVKLDFGYDPQFSPGGHELFVGLADFDPPQIADGEQIVQL
ncbi:GyrI-like domain-containing protein [Rhizobium sp. BK251]|uniref:GyrI-like domain-containing protein n=1 Tax=Rhizobium sp. BK251 TaxID=2512125 RepID=UPI00104D0556|nr:GyrI-like domain-containing protein [Rhizobium sp. BK251]TCL65714.1 putative transcriptional regulator YdeE [Rhizobium sp. BK251]